MKVSGKRAVLAIRDALEAAGLGRDSAYTGGEIAGWIPSNRFGSTGFSVRKETDGGLGWHVVVSGRKHLKYREWTEEEENGSIELHEPIEPERLCPRIADVFRSMGVPVTKVTCGGGQMHWDDDVSYDVASGHPDWLGKPDTANPFQSGEGPMLRAMAFSDRYDRSVPRLEGPLAGYVSADASYLTRESLLALRAAAAKAEASRADLVDRLGGPTSPRARGMTTKGMEVALSDDGVLVVAAPGLQDLKARPVTLTNHWGDEVEAWRMPSTWLQPQHAFRPIVPVLLGGEMRDSVPYATFDEQHGGEAPWIVDRPSAPAPR
jgi:hypothetical protein